MEEPFFGIQFAGYARRRWSVLAITCAVAVTLVAGVCLLLPKRYTATASILIEPPAGNDPRSATAVSPVYLDSLKTYERFASSDTMFTTAIESVGLKDKFGTVSIEAVKNSVLKVARPTNTKILEISVTLDNSRDAQRLAQRIAEQSVSLNKKLNDQSADDVLRDARTTLDKATARRHKAAAAKAEIVKAESIDALVNDVANANQVRLAIEKDLGKARAELADMEAEKKTFHDGDGMEEQFKWTLRQIEALRASVASLEAQSTASAKASADSATLLEARRQHRESIDTELRSAIADYEQAKTRLTDAQNSAAYRGERLEIMDPGIVPQRPSYPNTPLSIVVAFLVSTIASLAYLAIRFGYSRAHEYPREPEYRREPEYMPR